MSDQHRSDHGERHEFLSPEWIEAVLRIRDEFADRLPPPAVVVRANIVVTETPFGDDVRGSIDTSRGLALEPVELDAPDFTATLDYATAEALFLGQDPQAVFEAFFAGKIRLTGDATKLLAMQLPRTDAEGPEVEVGKELTARVRAITA